MTEDTPGSVRFGTFELDRHAAELRKNNRRVRLQEKPLRVLEALVERAGVLVTRDELRRRLWSSDTFVDFDNGLNNAVNRLRMALGDRAAAPKFIQTVGRRGYRFVAAVSEVPGGPADTADAAARERVITRLVVLPFRVLRADPETDFLAFSLPDAVAAALSGLESLAVRSSLAAARFAAGAPDLAAIARTLDVNVVLTGSILRDGGAVRVSVQLVDAPGGALLWTHAADVSLAQIFQLQDRLVRGIVESLALPLSLRDTQALERDVPASDRGFADYLRANRLSRDATTMAEARDLYLSAIQEDGRYAPTWARLAGVYRFIAKFGADDDVDYVARAEDAARRALALNPELSFAHYVQAQLELESGRVQSALPRLLDRARHRPCDPRLFVALVQGYRYAGLLDASMAADQRACALDPSSRTSVAYTYWMAGDLDRGIDAGRRVDDMGLGLLLVAAGRIDEARAWLVDAERRYAEFPVSRAFVRALSAYVVGNGAESIEHAAAVSQRPTFNDPEGLYYIAMVMMWNEESGRALDVLSHAVARGFACPIALDVDPTWRSLERRTDFVALKEVVARRHCELAAAFGL